MLKKFWQSVTVDRNFVATMFLKILICLVETPILYDSATAHSGAK